MKSPIKAKPLNNPAESLEKRLYEIAIDRLFFPVPIVIFSITYAAYEWLRWFLDLPPQPITFSIIALGATLYFGIRLRSVWPELKATKQGIAGEKAVGQFLERLRADGAFIFHDIPGDKFNLDHVVIHTSGIYVVETKTMSKPLSGKTELQFDGQSVLRNGKPLPMNPIPQVNAGSAWLSELLNESTGSKFSVRGVVTFPGWFIRSSVNTSHANTWVLNPKAIPAFINSQQQTLTLDRVNLAKFHLDRYIRAR